MNAPPLLEIEDLHVTVDGSEILRGVSLAVAEGEVHRSEERRVGKEC